MERISILAEGLLDCQERLCSMELVSLGKEMYQSIHPSVNRRQFASWGWNNYVSRKIVWRVCQIIAGYTWDGKFPVAQNRNSVTRHEGWATETGDCSVGRSTVVIHSEYPENG